MMEEKFYRFRNLEDWNADRFLSEMEDIAQNQLTFASPELFNDPFDCNCELFPSAPEKNRVFYIVYSLGLIQGFKNQDIKLFNNLGYNFEELYKACLPLYLIVFFNVLCDDVRYSTDSKDQVYEDFKNYTKFGIELKKITDLNNLKKTLKSLSENLKDKTKYIAEAEKITAFVEVKEKILVIFNSTEYEKLVGESMQKLDNFTYNFIKDFTGPNILKLNDDVSVIRLFCAITVLQWFHTEQQKLGIGVCCFAKDIKSQYYWAHYAGSHYGYAIEYGFINIAKHEKHFVTPLTYPTKVYYADNIDDLKKEYETNNPIGTYSNFLIKSTSWKAEKEYRMTAPLNTGKEFQKLKAPFCKITAIYLGMRFNESSQKAKHLFEVAKKSNIKLYKMEKDEDNQFSMAFKEFKPKKA